MPMSSQLRPSSRAAPTLPLPTFETSDPISQATKHLERVGAPVPVDEHGYFNVYLLWRSGVIIFHASKFLDDSPDFDVPGTAGTSRRHRRPCAVVPLSGWGDGAAEDWRLNRQADEGGRVLISIGRAPST